MYILHPSFTSSMTPSSPLPAQQQEVSTLLFMHVPIYFMYTFVFLYIPHDIFFTTTCTTAGSKYSCVYANIYPLYVHFSFFTSSLTPTSPLHTCTTAGSKYSCVYASVYPLYVHFYFFTSSMIPTSPLRTCTTAGSKYSCVYASVYPLYVHFYFFTSSMTPTSPLHTCTSTGSKYSCVYACVHPLMYTFVSLYIFHDTFFTTTCTTA